MSKPKLYIYRVTNTANNGIWIVAEDMQSARVFAVKKGHGRRAENLSAYLCTGDFDGFDLSNLTPGILCIEHASSEPGAEQWLRIIP